MAGLKAVPCLVDSKDDSTGERTLALQLVENIQRAELTSLERAHAISALKESHSLSVRQVAERLGISKSMVQRSLEILDLPDDLLNALREGAAESKVLLLAQIDDPEIRASYLKDLDVLTRTKIKKNLDDNKKTSAKSTTTPEDRRIADEIQRSIGLKVSLHRTSPQAEGGRVAIEFYSNEDLKEVYRRLTTE
jgi:ParB family chromosome partitioning protein